MRSASGCNIMSSVLLALRGFYKLSLLSTTAKNTSKLSDAQEKLSSLLQKLFLFVRALLFTIKTLSAPCKQAVLAFLLVSSPDYSIPAIFYVFIHEGMSVTSSK